MDGVFLDLSDASEDEFSTLTVKEMRSASRLSLILSVKQALHHLARKNKLVSKKRALTKAERKRLSERLCEADLPLLWYQITCKLSESTPTISESTSQSNGSKSSSSHDSHAGNGDDYDKLLTRVLSASTASTLTDIVLHLRDTFVRVYSKCEGRQIKEKYCTFQLEWHKHCSAFLLEKSLPMDTIGLPESENKVLAERRVDWIQFCEKAGVNQEARNHVMMEICAALYNFLLQRVSQFIKKEIIGEPVN